MIEVLSKPADQISISDIKSLIDSQVPEGEQIEFKENLPAKKGNTDPWIEGKNQIGDRAKNEILEEVVAFANAYGGVCLLGIKESSTKPPVAAEISPIPIIENLSEPWRSALQSKDGTQIYNEAQDTEPTHWRPILRGARAEYFSEENHPQKVPEQIYREIHCDGLIELGHLLGTYEVQEKQELFLPPAYPLVLFANLIAQTHRVRNQAGVPVAEYAIEVEIHVKGVPAIVPRNNYFILGKLNPGTIQFPRYSYGRSSMGSPDSNTLSPTYRIRFIACTAGLLKLLAVEFIVTAPTPDPPLAVE